MNELQKRNSFEVIDRPSNYFNIYGNNTLKNADIVFLTDFFADAMADDEDTSRSLMNRIKNVKLINGIWSDQIILVEKCPYGSEIDITEGIDSKIAMNRRFWDDEEFCNEIKELNVTEFSIYVEKEVIEDNLDNKKYSLFFNKKGCFSSGTFLSLLENSSRRVIEETLKIKKEFDLRRFSQFDYLMRRVMRRIEKEHHDKVSGVYKNFFQKKLAVLKSKIEEVLKLNNRVIVVLNGSLIFKNDRLHGNEFKLDPIHVFISDKKFVVVSAKKSCFRMANTPKLWDVDFKEK